MGKLINKMNGMDKRQAGYFILDSVIRELSEHFTERQAESIAMAMMMVAANADNMSVCLEYADNMTDVEEALHKSFTFGDDWAS